MGKYKEGTTEGGKMGGKLGRWWRTELRKEG